MSDAKTNKPTVGNRQAYLAEKPDCITGKMMQGWFYNEIWLAPEDDPERAERVLRTLESFFNERRSHTEVTHGPTDRPGA